jgi:hypothetical protein
MAMRQMQFFAGIACGIAVGLGALWLMPSSPRELRAASGDRYQDYVMVTGAVSINPRIQTDGVWLLDYKSGRLLGTVIDKQIGKIVGFAEVDLATEFGVEPRQDVHFLMTTGYITQGQSALYIAETTSGKFGVYTMGPGTNGAGLVIRRHDMTNFRQAPAPEVSPAAAGLPAGVPIEQPKPQPPVPGDVQPVPMPIMK